MSGPAARFGMSQRMISFLLIFIGTHAVRAQTVDFAKEIRPLFAARCYSCHGPEKPKNGLRLDSKAAAMSGGDSGKAILPGKSPASLLIQRVSSADKRERMPPTGDPLTTAQIAMLKSWIDQGAVWPDDGPNAVDKRDWWAYKPIVRPAIPQIRNTKSVIRNPIDSFIVAKLEEKGLSPSPEAGRQTLIRRLYFDLIGLPPSPEDVDAFVSDRDPLAYEK